MRVPAMVVRQIGMTSCSSASKTLQVKMSVPLSDGPHARKQTFCAARSATDIPVEVLAGANGHEGI